VLAKNFVPTLDCLLAKTSDGAAHRETRFLLISGSKVRALVRPPSKSKTYRKVDSLGNRSREEEERILALKGCDAVCGLMRVKALALAERLRCTRCL
jgi:hypothetical protein